MRLRSTLLAAVVTAAGLNVVTASPASAATFVDITNISHRQQLTGTQPVQISTDAPYVRVIADSSSSWDAESISEIVTVTDGSVVWQWPTYGFGVAPQLTVLTCSDSSANTCGGYGEAVYPTVVNDVSSFSAPTGPVFVNPDQDEPVTVTVADDTNPGGTLRVRHGDGLTPVVAGEPTGLTFPGVDYAEAPLRVERCSLLNPAICSSASLPSAEVTVRRAIVPVAIVSSEQFSPNGDGVKDTAAYALVQPDATQERAASLTDVTATWTVTDLGGTALGDPQPITIAPDTWGRSAFQLDPAAVGLTLADGSYKVRVDVTANDHGRAYAGSSSATFQVKVTPDTITALTPQWATFYPKYDATSAYRDEVSVAVTGQHSNQAQVQVINAAGTVVDSAYNYGDRFVWDGRNNAGSVFAEGQYRFRYTLVDVAGNTSVFTGGAVNLSRKAYVAKSWTRTISAQGSLARNFSGTCGLLRKPGLKGGPGSIGYYSQGKCRGATFNSRIAAGLHSVQLPAGSSYGTIRMWANGGAVKTGSQAALLWINNRDDVAGSMQVLTPGWTSHYAGGRRAPGLMWSNRRIYWIVNTAYGLRYDVKSFKLQMNYVRFE